MTDMEKRLAEALRRMVNGYRPSPECTYCGAYGDETHKLNCVWAHGDAVLAEYDAKMERRDKIDRALNDEF